MTRTTLPALACLALVACADDAPTPANPDKLWLALDGSEVQVRLVAAEPAPF